MKVWAWFLCLGLMVALTACSGPGPIPTSTSTPRQTATPTATSLPPPPTPTLTPTPTPPPLATLVLTPTPRPKPTATPTSLSEATIESLPYVHRAEGFSIQPPKGWTIDDSGSFGTYVFFLNPQSDSENANRFGANINIISELTVGLGLTGYVAASKENLPKFLTDYQFIEDKRVTVNGREVHLLGGTWVQDTMHLRNFQLIAMRQGKAYIVTAAALEKTWDKYQDVFQKSLATFKFTRD